MSRVTAVQLPRSAAVHLHLRPHDERRALHRDLSHSFGFRHLQRRHSEKQRVRDRDARVEHCRPHFHHIHGSARVPRHQTRHFSHPKGVPLQLVSACSR